MEPFGITVNSFEERPVTSARIFPKLNQVVTVHGENFPKFFGNGSQVNLERMDRRVKY